jgi:hypothetical protein
MIDNLMNDQDVFQIVRDKIALILATEIQNQMALAVVALKDPLNYYARVYTERTRAWEQFLNVPVVDDSPLINVSYETSNFDKGTGNTVSRQKSSTIYNIDCYGYGSAEGVAGGGQLTGDMLANFKVQNAIRIVRNILMASEYVTLGLDGIVWQRWITTVNVFQPIIDVTPVQNVVGARISFAVDFNEYAPQVTPSVLSEISVDVTRAVDGQIIVEADYNF